MSLLVTGTIGIDTVETPYGQGDEVLGGSAAYFSFAAGLMVSPVRLVAVVGEDFPRRFIDLFKQGPIDTEGLEIRAGAKTFRWKAKYLDDMNERETLCTELNVIAEAAPTIPPKFRDSTFLFLANTHPALQRGFIGQLAKPKLIVCDTMNLWIETARDELLKTLAVVHGVLLNDSEARMLTGQNNLILAGRGILDFGPRFVVIKKGEHGAMLVTRDEVFVIPAFPSTNVKDPTGAGDSFGGGMMGYLASVDRTDMKALKTALAYGTCVASITIEDFSLDSLRAANRAAVDARLREFKATLSFE
ncbi:MAG TPA: PfkB family carbohydrate kinase [Phycisphaerae bacterium]|nr:PfkB family carbohydrate kinase [Phycisphaerae bacterium]